ncbi:IS66 family insertion sequence element accessory protein TnpA [Natranaerobius trueperi]|uniref:IS66 family insertion sequence element accessory protein TnpA n=1 Tax=Natranaerobius trueperi TaxID=759412 RepID=UPI003B833989
MTCLCKNKYERRRESWKQHIAEFRSSGMTTREWCNTHNKKIKSKYSTGTHRAFGCTTID